ncbi:hypothetical protein [Mucilaginibacter ginkgonis]|uniref:Uncharacterized protein n=1 Tax=Mucilaginibacter ginkgonis TaxID=2682091 RepID=A0A6I4HVS5_9SPHI|nr:hypothetical protein [Mucilaginibacter ginkgonis]QQL50276.1 hypothetical protein GO620_002135 [Mucilaginibacter ginkgonis]
MNSFYDIGTHNKISECSYQLENLGSQRAWASFGKRIRGDWGERDQYETNTIFTDVTAEDYDKQFITRLLRIRPSYKIDGFIDHHLNHFLRNNPGGLDDFIKHMRYEIYPELRKRGSEAYIDLFGKWLSDKSTATHAIQTVNNTINITGNNAPIQFQQNSAHAVQTQNNDISESQIREFLETVRLDLHHIDANLRSDFEIEMNYAVAQLDKGRDAQPQLSRIYGLMRDIGLGTFTNLLASPIYDLIKHFLHL